MLEIGTILQHRYVIEGRIGQGGMGAVYLAVDQKFSANSRVAIKERFYETPELAEAFVREARLLNSLHHPILPHVSDYFSEAGGNFLVMEYIEGEDLSEIIKRKGAFPFPDVMRWTREILDGLDYLHSQVPPVTHRDIKPNNLKLTSRGFIVLLDFGLAKETEGETLSERSIFGYSKKYSPLEQIEGVGSDARSDIFSLGATVYHLLGGQPPADALARASAIVSGQPDPLTLANEINTEIPEAVAHVLHTALALNADQRFLSATAMRSALDYALDPEAAALLAETASADAAGASLESSVPIQADVRAFPALQAFKAELEQNSTDAPSDTVPMVTVPVVSPGEGGTAQDSPAESQYNPPPAVSTPLVEEMGLIDAADKPAERNNVTRTGNSYSEESYAANNVPQEDRNLLRPAVWLPLLLVLGLLGLGYSLWPSADVEPTAAADESTAAIVAPDNTAVSVAKEQEVKVAPVATKTKQRSANTDRVTDEETAAAQDSGVPAEPAPETRTNPVVRNTVGDRPRVVRRPATDTGAPVSSIENVFTGVTPEERRDARRRANDEADEAEEARRERRRIRRQNRQNTWPF